MGCVRVRDWSGHIVEKCFTQEVKEALEFTINETQMSVEDQLLYHYWNAYYFGTRDLMVKAIIYKIHQNMDLILRLQDLKKNILRILDLGEYSKVTLGYKETLGTESSIGVSAANSKTKNLQSDRYEGQDTTRDININDERTATSQTNVTEELKIFIPQPEITEGQTKGKTYGLTETSISENEKESPKFTLNNPQMNEDGASLGFQNVSKNLSTSDSANTSNTASSRGTESRGDIDNKNARTEVKGAKSDEINRTSEFVTNDARLKVWKAEIPKLQTRFWNCLFNLFEYEEY